MATAGAAAEMILRGVLEGSLLMQEMQIERRPYHRNCSCALHNLKGACSSCCSRAGRIFYSKKKTWSDCSLSMATSHFSSQYSLLAAGPDVRSMDSKASWGVLQLRRW